VRTVLFGWELGANLGHAMPLAAIARRISGAGVRIAVAARDLLNARLAFADLDADVMQAPVWPHHRHFGSETGQESYLDVLAQIGFADQAKLSAVTGAWLALMDFVRPDAIVADHSPALLLAARIRGTPVVQVGSGFTMPPADYDRLPPIRADRAPIMPEERARDAIASVAAEHGATTPDSLSALFRTAARIVFGCPELDPYASFRRETLFLPPELLPRFIVPPVVPRLFVYLGPEIPGIDLVIQTLGELGIELDVYLRGALAPHRRFLSLAGHRVYETPPSLADVLPSVSHVLSAGGAFTSHAALAAGRPMLAFTLHGEAEANVAMMSRLGVARALAAGLEGPGLKSALLAFLRDHALLQRAVHWAKVLESRPQPDGGEATNAAILSLLQSATPKAIEPEPSRGGLS
jgi:UDP:flavonoid glycosyltransferase YjiC (YdhE family)